LLKKFSLHGSSRPELKALGRDSDHLTGLRGQIYANAKKILVWSVVGAALALATILPLISVHEKSALSKSANAAISYWQDRTESINLSFDRLHALTQVPCSDAHINAMRAIAFESLIIRDVFYLNAHRPLCSSTSGASIEQWPARSNPDFVSERSRSIWRDIEISLAPGVRSSLAVEGDYGMLIGHPDAPIPISAKGYRLNIVFVNRKTSVAWTTE